MRLTFVNPDGTWGISGVCWEKVPGELYGALYKLKDYEEICASVDDLRQVSELFLEKCEEVNRLQVELELNKNKRPLPYSRPEHCLDCQLLNRDDDCVLQSEKANRAAGESWEALMQGCPLQAVRENGWIPLWQPLPASYRERVNKMTNLERIQSMSLEDIVDIINRIRILIFVKI